MADTDIEVVRKAYDARPPATWPSRPAAPFGSNVWHVAANRRSEIRVHPGDVSDWDDFWS